MRLLIDVAKEAIYINESFLLIRIIALALSVFFTALGMVFMINMNLIQNPPDGTVKAIGKVLHIEIGKMKLIYDISMVISSGLMSFFY